MSYVLKQIKTLRETIKSRSEIKAVSALVLFLLINVLKITLFNYCLIEKHNRLVFEYKMGITLLLIFILYTLILALKSRIVFLVFYIFQIVYILINISYYLYFHSYLQILQFIMLFSEGFAAAGHSAAPVSIQFLIAFIDLPVFIYVFVNYKNISEIRAKLRFFRYLLVLTSLITFVSIETYNYAHNYSLINFVNSRFVGESLIVERYGTVINNMVGFYLKRNDKAMISQFEYGEELKNNKEVSEKPNIVYIQVESMDANVINQKYKGDYIAPNLHEMSQKNVYYPYVLSYHMGGGTSDSEFSIINSIEPIDGYPAMKIANYNHPNSFIKILSTNSYRTMAFHGNSGGFFNRNVAFPKMGFEEFFDMGKMNLEHVGWGAPDRDVFINALKEFGNARQPFFSYVITMTSHGPFTNANNYYNNSRYSDIKSENVKNYFNSMSYVDEEISEFVKKIKSEYKNTYIFICGDHTPSINENEYKQASVTLDGKYLEFVPLILITPDNKVYKENKSVVSFLDISPTVLNLSGGKYTVKSDGHDLLNFNEKGKGIPFKGSVFDREELLKRYKP